MKKLLKLIGKYKIFLVFSVIFAAISVVLQLYVPVLFGDAIDEVVSAHQVNFDMMWYYLCLLYTSDAADEEDSVALGGRRIMKKKKQKT